MCKVLEVSVSGYYKWKQGLFGSSTGKNLLNIDKEIRVVWEQSQKRYGAPKIQQELAGRGIRSSRQRIQRRMKKMGIRSSWRKKYRPATTDSNHPFPVSENMLNRDFTAENLAQKWVGDITYLRYSGGWSYLTVVIDLADHQVVGWTLSKDMTDDSTTIAAFRRAAFRRKPGEKMIFHSDRGSQYASADFRKELAGYTISQSMSRRGNCWDIAVAESFFNVLKRELLVKTEKLNFDQLKTELFTFIELWYNRKRIHSVIGFITPYEMGNRLAKIA
jgi:putative transposase